MARFTDSFSSTIMFLPKTRYPFLASDNPKPRLVSPLIAVPINHGEYGDS